MKKRCALHGQTLVRLTCIEDPVKYDPWVCAECLYLTVQALAKENEALRAPRGWTEVEAGEEL